MKKIISSITAAFCALVAFNSCSDVPAPYILVDGETSDTTTTVSPAGDGTLANPYNIAAMNKIASSLESGSTSETTYYFKGIVASIKEVSASYGNATFYISDDGSSTDKFYIYHAYGFDNKKITDENMLQVGDTVVICGKITNYNGTIETVGNGAYIYSVNGKGGSGAGGDDTPTGTPKGSGTLASPYNIAAITAKAKELATGATSEDSYYFEGVVDSVKEISTNYGNATFFLSDDGTKSGHFLVYQALGLENKNITNEKLFKVGDKIVVCGKIANFKGTLETAKKEAYIYSINGVTKGDDSGSQGGGGDNTPSGKAGTVNISGTTVTLTASDVTAGTESVTFDLNTLGLTDGTTVDKVTFSDGTTVTFDKGGNTNGPKFYAKTKGLRIYSKNTLTFNAGSKKIAKIVFTCDSYNDVDYVGNTSATATFNGASAVYTNAYSGSDSGVQLRAQTITITYGN